MKLIISIRFGLSELKPESESTCGMNSERVLLHILHSAAFWECRNIRGAFLDLSPRDLGAISLTYIFNSRIPGRHQRDDLTITYPQLSTRNLRKDGPSGEYIDIPSFLTFPVRIFHDTNPESFH